MTRSIRAVAYLLAALCLTSTSALAQDRVFVDNGRGQVPLWLPSDYDPSEPLPLIVALHGYGGSSNGIEAYFNFVRQIETNRFIYCIPEGTTDRINNRFWNATDACCDFFDTGIDDSAYLSGLIDVIRAEFAVDDLSIHVVGHSNGGFMAFRMACDHADQVASIVSLAGRSFLDVNECSPSEPVDVLHISGTADGVIRFNGGCTAGGCYPGAEQTVLDWATYDGCDPVSRNLGKPFDLDVSVSGNEATKKIYDQSCNSGSVAELWTLAGSGHSPTFWNRGAGEGPQDNRFALRTVEWMLSHRKPLCRADTNGDGQVDSEDFFLFLDAFASGNLAVCDLNGDGTCDSADFFMFLDLFVTC